jgi:hypothetical protein
MKPDDDPEQQSEEKPSDNDQPADQPEDQPGGSDQAVDQSEEQPTESDQSAEQAEQQPADNDQSAEQPEEPSADTDQAVGQSEDQPADSDQPVTSGSASDTVPSAGGAGATKVGTRNIKVVAEFTEEGQKFIGDILIHVFESDNGQQGRLLFQTGGQFWQNTAQKGNVVTTPMLRVATSEVLIFAHARVLLPTGDYQTMDSQDFKIPMPSGDTLQVKFDVGVGEIENKVNAPDEGAAKAKVYQSPQLKGHFVKGDLKAEPMGNQQFRVTGKFLSGDITLL